MRGLYLTLGLFGLELNWITFPHIVDLLFRRSERKEFRALERHRLEVFAPVMFGTLIFCLFRWITFWLLQALEKSKSATESGDASVQGPMRRPTLSLGGCRGGERWVMLFVYYAYQSACKEFVVPIITQYSEI